MMYFACPSSFVSFVLLPALLNLGPSIASACICAADLRSQDSLGCWRHCHVPSFPFDFFRSKSRTLKIPVNQKNQKALEEEAPSICRKTSLSKDSIISRSDNLTSFTRRKFKQHHDEPPFTILELIHAARSDVSVSALVGSSSHIAAPSGNADDGIRLPPRRRAIGENNNNTSENDGI
jgi:hypothetical protein